MQGSTLSIYKSLFFTGGQSLAETESSEVIFEQQFKASTTTSSAVYSDFRRFLSAFVLLRLFVFRMHEEPPCAEHRTY